MTTLPSLHRTLVLNKSLRHLFAALSLGMIALPPPAHAASSVGDYVTVPVPNLTQAVTFFLNVMNCSITRGDGAAASMTTALMTCGRETIVEIAQVSGRPASHAATPSPALTLNTDDASAIASWLRANHVKLVGAPTWLTSGQDAGKLAVIFLTPWGQPLRLLSRTRGDDLPQSPAPASRVAAQ